MSVARLIAEARRVYDAAVDMKLDPENARNAVSRLVKAKLFATISQAKTRRR